MARRARRCPRPTSPTRPRSTSAVTAGQGRARRGHSSRSGRYTAATCTAKRGRSPPHHRPRRGYGDLRYYTSRVPRRIPRPTASNTTSVARSQQPGSGHRRQCRRLQTGGSPQRPRPEGAVSGPAGPCELEPGRRATPDVAETDHLTFFDHLFTRGPSTRPPATSALDCSPQPARSPSRCRGGPETLHARSHARARPRRALHGDGARRDDSLHDRRPGPADPRDPGAPHHRSP